MKEFLKELNPEQQKALMSIINSYSDGQHPPANEDTLKYFTPECMIRSCLDAAMSMRRTLQRLS